MQKTVEIPRLAIELSHFVPVGSAFVDKDHTVKKGSLVFIISSLGGVIESARSQARSESTIQIKIGFKKNLLKKYPSSVRMPSIDNIFIFSLAKENIIPIPPN